MKNEEKRQLLEEFFEYPTDPPSRSIKGQRGRWLDFVEGEAFYRTLPADMAALGTMNGHIRLVKTNGIIAKHRIAHHVTKIFKKLYEEDPDLLLNAHKLRKEMLS